MGCDVLEVAPQRQGDVLEVEWEDGTRTTATFWADVATEGEGHVLARIAGGPWAGRPVVFETRLGKGVAYYLGARLDNAGLSRVYDRAPALAGAATLGRSGVGPAGDGRRQAGSAVVRASSTHSFEFLINHSSHRSRGGDRARTGSTCWRRSHLGDRLVLPPTGVAIMPARTRERCGWLTTGRTTTSWNAERLAPRTAFVPFPDVASARSYEPALSPAFRSLSGNWRFHLAPRPSAAPQGLRRSRLRRRGMGRDPGPVALAARGPWPPAVHQLRLPLPGRPARGALREPDRLLPPRGGGQPRMAGARFDGGAAIRGRRQRLPRVVERGPGRLQPGQPVAVGVRCHQVG